MKVNKIVILESNKNENRKIRKICKRVVKHDEHTINFVNSPIENEPHCDAIIYGEIDGKRVAVLLEITGKNIRREDYEDKPKNTIRYIEGDNIRPIKALHAEEGFGTHTAKLIPKCILRIDCRSNKGLCEYLS